LKHTIIQTRDNDDNRLFWTSLSLLDDVNEPLNICSHNKMRSRCNATSAFWAPAFCPHSVCQLSLGATGKGLQPHLTDLLNVDQAESAAKRTLLP
jgi:hypothetical protein